MLLNFSRQLRGSVCLGINGESENQMTNEPEAAVLGFRSGLAEAHGIHGQVMSTSSL